MNAEFNQLISTGDLFKLLIHKVPNFYMQADRYIAADGQEEYKPICLFKESVRVLESLEKFVVDLNEGTLPAVDEDIFKTKHICSNNEYLKYFDDLKFLESMFDTTYLQLSQNWLRYINFLKGDWEGIETYQNTEFIKNVRYINSIGQPEYTQQWDPWKFSREKAIRLQHTFLKKTDKYSENLEYKFNLRKAYEQFDELLRRYNKLYTFTIDLRFARPIDSINREPLGTFLEQILRDRDVIQLFLAQQVSDVFQIYTKLEHDFQNGLKLSCIFICKSNVESYENTLIPELKERLAQAFQQYCIEVIDGNKVIKKHAHEQAIGLIKRKDKEQIKLFKYWVLSYFYRIDSLVKLIYPKIAFEVNNTLEPSIQSFSDNLPKIGNAKEKGKKDSFTEVLQKWNLSTSIWKLNYVPKRLSVSQIFYKELCAEYDLPQYGELLFQIQILIETMLKKNDIAFNAYHKDSDAIINKKDLKDISTQVGQQFLFIIKSLSNCPNAFKELNNLFGRMGRGLGLAEIEIFISNVLYIFHQSYISHPLKVSSLEQFNQTLLVIKQQIILDRASREIHKDKYQDAYDLCARRQNEATRYISSVLKQDCLAYRVTIQARVGSRDFKQKEFSKLFTDFMRSAKRAQPCSWLQGYMGIWQEVVTLSEFEIDLVLFFSDKCQPEKERVVEMLNIRWQNFLKEKAKTILEWESLEDKTGLKFYGSISSKNLMHSVGVFKKQHHTQGIYLEASNVKMKNLFLEQVIPFFAYRDFFRPALTQKVPKVFIKGGGKEKSS
ncbi:hypothetical protein IIQ44_18370 [Acinetobacter oleivorans]|uniref:hypothetical protein n=1 Tax=Acinetobacter TaxID=469 RepID=UPI00178C9EEB|nr:MULTISPECIES: hypothetical protein [Acinetobacter]MBE2173864.1 hypothetical protein [Acinetobacter oleivorans]MCG6037440.1 hypothetical protein [Acinetobacter baumannii]MCU4424417.1 hypothetical protein [Acinetobacter sp. WU_MDCI_Abxb74]